MRDRIFSHQVIDEFGDILKRFQSLREAKWFVSNKPDCTIQALQVSKESDYELGLREVGECLL